MILNKLLIPASALLLAALISLLPIFQRLDYWLSDAQQWLVASEQYYDDVLLIDIGDPSLRELKQYFGPWPYTRDTYAVLLDYLTEMGAKTIILDILLTDPRENDALLAEAIQRNRNTVLITSAPSDDAVSYHKETEQLSPFAWQVPKTLPMTAWQSILTPVHVLTENSAAVLRLGMASVIEDKDGLLRRFPLMHYITGIALPSVPLAALAQNGKNRSLNHNTVNNTAAYDDFSWPIDGEGKVHISYPRNPNSVLTMPFHQVAKAALGLIQLKDADTFFRGKVIFIGSTAQHSDRVATPRGIMSGTAVLAIAYQSLKTNQVFTPANNSWNSLQTTIALLSILLVIVLQRNNYRLTAVVMMSAMLTTYLINFTLLSLGQQSALLLPLSIEAGGWILLAMQQKYDLQKKNVHLDEKSRLLEQANIALEAIASIDPLTSLLTRRSFLEQFLTEIERSIRMKEPLSVAILDLDHFKNVNDTYGHQVGDLVLKRFAAVLKSNLRSMDIAGRWGGEEFVVLLPATPVDEAMRVLDRIRITISQESFPAPAESLKVNLSAGLTGFDRAVMDPEEIVGIADKGLYDAKESGRNRICVALKNR